MRAHRSILLTGATGFVGGELIGRLLRARPDATLVCLVRASDDADLKRRRESILDWSRVPVDDAHRVSAVAGCMEREDLGLGYAYGSLAEQVEEIYHVAASTRFDLSLEDARRINVNGMANVIRFARAADHPGGLRRLHHVSTAYVVGDRSGVLNEAETPAQPNFRNAYEQSKWEAEVLRSRAMNELPMTCYRPSIIVGDSTSGRTKHFRVLYDPIKWVYFGKTDLLPCQPEIRVDVVPVDFVCDAIIAIGARAESIGQTYHLTAGPDRALTIAQMIEMAVAEGNRYHAEIGGPMIESPRIVSPDMLEAAGGEEREKVQQLLARGERVLRLHMPYMLVEQLFESTLAHSLLSEEGIRCPHLGSYFSTLVRWGVERKFNGN